MLLNKTAKKEKNFFKKDEIWFEQHVKKKFSTMAR